MAKTIPSVFCGIEFTDPREALESRILNSSQRSWLQFNLSLYASERIALTIDPTNTLPFIQKDAELKGQIGFIQYLLDCSDKASAELITLVQNPTNRPDSDN